MTGERDPDCDGDETSKCKAFQTSSEASSALTPGSGRWLGLPTDQFTSAASSVAEEPHGVGEKENA